MFEHLPFSKGICPLLLEKTGKDSLSEKEERQIRLILFKKALGITSRE